MNKISLTTFTAPMMGLSYECEPLIDSGEIHIRNVKRGWFVVRN